MIGVDDIQTQLLQDRSRLIRHVIDTLNDRFGPQKVFPNSQVEWETTAGVLMLLGQKPGKQGSGGEPCIVLNKRSLKVRQPGDLCFPGGRMAPRIDPYLARFFSLPFASLGLWRHWGHWKKGHRRQAELMAVIWATGLRESFEEMRLNPFGVRFLGPLAPQPLVMFRRTIYPMVGWIKHQKRFFPNWEVDKVLYVPLRDLLNPKYYGRYRLRMTSNPGRGPIESIEDYPCFRLQNPHRKEVLWGATYRITINFLEHVFGFKPPAVETLPVVEGTLDESYLTGKR
jgi:hypothetical protein